MFNRDTEKETITILLRENKKLKRDNQMLRESLDKLERYKAEYKELNKYLKKIKESYSNRLDEFNKIESEYKKGLSEIVRKINNK